MLSPVHCVWAWQHVATKLAPACAFACSLSTMPCMQPSLPLAAPLLLPLCPLHAASLFSWRCSRGREEHPVRTLDELFRKTTAKPCIYWLPLTGARGLPRCRLEVVGWAVGSQGWKFTAGSCANRTCRQPPLYLGHAHAALTQSRSRPLPMPALQTSRLRTRSARRRQPLSRRSSRRPTALLRRSDAGS